MFDEITRILNHLMWLGTHGLDVGAMSIFLYAFRERERQERQERLQKQQERKQREHDEYLRKQKVNNIYMNQ
jgi:NADH:ubiquinone oxidoreductase subunit D